jgi:hypothetical protein
MVMGEFDFVGICEAPHHAVMARTSRSSGASASWRRSFAEMAEDRSGDALSFERASNRPHDRARDSSLVGVLNRCLNRAMVT